MMELNGEPSTGRWLPSHVYADLGVATSRMAYLVACYSSPGDPRRGPYVLGVEHRASGRLLGHVGFSPFDSDVEVSYAIAEDSRRRGYGAEALRHGCRWAAEKFDLARILAITESANAPSRRTLERAGFAHEEDTVMRFQGSEETVSRYAWHSSHGANGMESIEARSDSRSRVIAASPANVFAALSDPRRVARWWGPSGFTSTIHEFDFRAGGRWLLTMHGPDGKDYPNESRFTRIAADRVWEIEHLSGHHFFLTIELDSVADGTTVRWTQTFDTKEHYDGIAAFVAQANEQNLERLAAEVRRDGP